LLTERIKLNLLFKLSYLNSNFTLTLGYHNLALYMYNGAQSCIILMWELFQKLLKGDCTSHGCLDYDKV